MCNLIASFYLIIRILARLDSICVACFLPAGQYPTLRTANLPSFASFDAIVVFMVRAITRSLRSMSKPRHPRLGILQEAAIMTAHTHMAVQMPSLLLKDILLEGDVMKAKTFARCHSNQADKSYSQRCRESRLCEDRPPMRHDFIWHLEPTI